MKHISFFLVLFVTVMISGCEKTQTMQNVQWDVVGEWYYINNDIDDDTDIIFYDNGTVLCKGDVIQAVGTYQIVNGNTVRLKIDRIYNASRDGAEKLLPENKLPIAPRIEEYRYNADKETLTLVKRENDKYRLSIGMEYKKK